MMIMTTEWLCLNGEFEGRRERHAYFLGRDGRVAVGCWSERKGATPAATDGGLLDLDAGRAAILDFDGVRVPVAGGRWVVDGIAAAGWLLPVLRTAGVTVQCDRALGSIAGAVAEAMQMMGADLARDAVCAGLAAVDAYEPAMGRPGQTGLEFVAGVAHLFHGREDGLHHCKNCGGAEASLPTHCPGFQMSDEVEKAVQFLGLDFVDGRWLWRGLSNAVGTHPEAMSDANRLV